MNAGRSPSPSRKTFGGFAPYLGLSSVWHHYNCTVRVVAHSSSTEQEFFRFAVAVCRPSCDTMFCMRDLQSRTREPFISTSTRYIAGLFRPPQLMWYHARVYGRELRVTGGGVVLRLGVPVTIVPCTIPSYPVSWYLSTILTFAQPCKNHNTAGTTIKPFCLLGVFLVSIAKILLMFKV